MVDKVTILFVSANPSNTGRLRLDEEIREIEAQISIATYRDCFDLVSVWAVRPADLKVALLTHNPDIVHFSGHSTRDMKMVFENRQGRRKSISSKALACLLAIFRDKIRLVFLNSCYSDLQLNTFIQHIDYAIGVQGLFSDKTAIVFAASFYQALAFGLPIKEAFELAKNEIVLEGLRSASAPTLYMRDGINFSEPLIKPQIAHKPKENQLTPLSSLSIGLDSRPLESTRGVKEHAKRTGKSSRKSRRPPHERQEVRDLLIKLKAITEELIASLDE